MRPVNEGLSFVAVEAPPQSPILIYPEAHRSVRIWHRDQLKLQGWGLGNWCEFEGSVPLVEIKPLHVWGSDDGGSRCRKSWHHP